MKRTLVVLGALVLVLVTLRAALVGTAPQERGAIERLAGSALGDRRTVAALSVEAPGGARWLFARSKGRWRAREAFGAFLDEAALQGWLAAILDARGVVVERDPARADAFGLGADAVVRIGLHGPKVLDAADRDVVLQFDVGRGAGGRTFARRAGADAVLELDRDVLAALGPIAERSPQSGGAVRLPALVDLHLLAGSLEPGVLGFREITLERRGGERLVLRRVPGDDGTEPRWTLAHDGVEEDALPWRAGGFLGLLLRGEAIGFASVSEAPALGLEAPFARLVLVPDAGETIVLALSDRTAANDGWVWNRRTNLVLHVDATTHAELAPDAAAFLRKEGGNPWERWLRNLGPTARK
ncbi:MAG: hypothetical protein IPJ77_20785 [Planctomycetes bacterium]|nr:hypothetical protein [Planctomycetota bacterium]